MAKIAGLRLCLKSSAKVLHFCELCKKKFKKIYTISVNISLQILYTFMLFANINTTPTHIHLSSGNQDRVE